MAFAEVRVPSGVCGHLDLNGTGILQANDLSNHREGAVQPGCSGAILSAEPLNGIRVGQDVPCQLLLLLGRLEDQAPFCRA